MPLSKRRSCTACVKSKRKCSLTAPACHRCQSRSLDCVYEGEQSSVADTHGQLPPSVDLSIYAAPGMTDLPDAETSQFLFSVDDSLLASTFADPDPDSNLDPDLDLYLSSTSCFVPTVASDVALVPHSLADEIISDNSTMSGAVFLPRTRWDIARIRSWPSHLVSHLRTPFIHASAFAVSDQIETSDILRDVLSCSALYSALNTSNAAAVYVELTAKAARLINSSGGRASAREMLARTQALVLYQLLRLFDGDVRLRAEAERDWDVLERWTIELLRVFKPLRHDGGLAAHEREEEVGRKLDWQDWVFDESVRRTVLTSYMVQGLYLFQRDGFDPVCGKVEKLSFTAQKALWEAPSSYHWAQAWERQKRWEVRIGKWAKDTEGMQVCDCDDLGLVMMVTMRDLDGAAEWIGDMNEVEDYGLGGEAIKQFSGGG